MHGTSTREVDDPVAALGLEAGVSKSEVSRIYAGLDAERGPFRTRSLAHVGFPYLFCDATYPKGRVRGRVASRAVVVATGVTGAGDREVLGVDVGDSEDGAFWTAFLRGLRARGLSGVRPVISDHHLGPKAAVASVFVGAAEDLLAFTYFPQAHRRKVWSTNPLERVNGEIKRRTDVVGIFPDDAAIVRLVAAVCAKTHDERLYLSEDSMAKLHAADEPPKEAPLAVGA